MKRKETPLINQLEKELGLKMTIFTRKSISPSLAMTSQIKLSKKPPLSKIKAQVSIKNEFKELEEL